MLEHLAGRLMGREAYDTPGSMRDGHALWFCFCSMKHFGGTQLSFLSAKCQLYAVNPSFQGLISGKTVH